jgi:hypothetical protein
MLLAGLGGCMSTATQAPPDSQPAFNRVGYAREVPGVQGPYGQAVPSTATARGQAPGPMGSNSPIVQASALVNPPGGAGCDACGGAGCGLGCRLHNPAMGAPGFGPGGIYPVPPMGPPGAVAAVGALGTGAPVPGGGGPQLCNARSSVKFNLPYEMRVSWQSPPPDGGPTPVVNALTTPGRYNFIQGGIYRLKLDNIPNLPGVSLYPTLEVVPANIKTATFLAHSSIPINFTPTDFQQVVDGNFVVKVIYLPDPQFQDLAVAGPEEVVSTQLEPGVDPIVEAQRRGSILAIVRLGNIDLEAPNTPALDAPNPYLFGGMPPPGLPGAVKLGAVPPSPLPPGLLPGPRPVVPNGGPVPGGPVGPMGPVPPRAPVTLPPSGPALGH